MRPSRRVGQILDEPEQQHSGDNPKLAGNDHEHEATGSALIQSLHLVGGQILFFNGKQCIGHALFLLRNIELYEITSPRRKTRFQITRALFLSCSTSFFATSAGGPSSICVFFCFTGT